MSQLPSINSFYLAWLASSSSLSTATEVDFRQPSTGVPPLAIDDNGNTDWRILCNEFANRYIDLARAFQKSVAEAKEYKEKLDVCQQHDQTPLMYLIFHDNDVAIRPRQGCHPRLAVKYEDGMYVCYWGKRIVGYSTHRDGMLKEVNDTMVFLWREYVVRFEAKHCTRDAKVLHARLVKNFEEC